MYGSNLIFNFQKPRSNSVVLTFNQMGIKLVDYTGMTPAKRRPLIINIAADYYLELVEHDKEDDIFNHYDWEIDYLLGFVKIPPSALIK